MVRLLGQPSQPADTTTSSIAVTASLPGKLDAWFDFSGNGNWNDDGEQVFTSVDLSAGSSLLSFTVPAGCCRTNRSRFRLSSTGGLATTGSAADGEVEDYLFNVIDGNISGASNIRLQPQEPGTVDIVAEATDIVIRNASSEMFRAPGSSLQSIDITSTVGDDTINLANVDAVFSGRIIGDAREGNDRLNLTGSDQDFDMTSIDDGAIGSIETIDIRGSGNNRLSLTAADIIGLSNADNEVTLLMDSNDILDTNDSGFTITGVEVVEGELQVVATSGGATLKIRGANWTNPLDRYDVNKSGSVTPLDALVILNQLSRRDALVGSTSTLVDPTTLSPLPVNFYDVTGEGLLTPLDALRILNYLNRGGASGEAPEGNGDGQAMVSTLPTPLIGVDEDEEEKDEVEPIEPEQLT
ncbi:MAG: GEVED domain-containing protein [Pirellulaceae bacterium]